MNGAESLKILLQHSFEFLKLNLLYFKLELYKVVKIAENSVSKEIWKTAETIFIMVVLRLTTQIMWVFLLDFVTRSISGTITNLLTLNKPWFYCLQLILWQTWLMQCLKKNLCFKLLYLMLKHMLFISLTFVLFWILFEKGAVALNSKDSKYSAWNKWFIGWVLR